MLCRVALVRTDVSEELSASFMRVTRIGELETPLSVTSNRRNCQEIQILVTLMKEALSSPESRFLQEPHGVTSQTPFFIVTAVKTSNLTIVVLFAPLILTAAYDFYLSNATRCMQNVTKTSSYKLTICFNLTLRY
jgi:hypothetical protein